MPDHIITHHISPYHAVQGTPEELQALAASAPADPVTKASCCQPVRVKPLVWAYVGGETWIARTPIGIASVQKDTHGWGVWLAGQNSESVCWHVENTLDAAKAAAQADYEARILSAIEPAPVTPAEAAKVLLADKAALATLVDVAEENHAKGVSFGAVIGRALRAIGEGE